jgi:hypothetical protein
VICGERQTVGRCEKCTRFITNEQWSETNLYHE